MLDDTKKAVYDLICEGILKYGCPPTVREMSKAMKFSSPSGVVNHLKIMVRDGYLSHTDKSARGYFPIDFMKRVKESLRITQDISTEDLEKHAKL